MVKINNTNPFNAPVYHKETVTSTMDISRDLAACGEAHGTVITADFQNSGRGRIKGRSWQMESKTNLPFTILLRFPSINNIPKALTLRTGLAVSFAIEDFTPSLKDKVQIKWPNDIMINGKKAAGILCEADDRVVRIGIGVNVAQKEFPSELREKAISVSLAAGTDIAPEDRYKLLEKILANLYSELETGTDWKTRIEKRLYKKGEQVLFIEGAAGSGKEVKGTLTGINKDGELLIQSNKEKKLHTLITGELIL